MKRTMDNALDAKMNMLRVWVSGGCAAMYLQRTCMHTSLSLKIFIVPVCTCVSLCALCWCYVPPSTLTCADLLKTYCAKILLCVPVCREAAGTCPTPSTTMQTRQACSSGRRPCLPAHLTPGKPPALDDVPCVSQSHLKPVKLCHI
jgi:hypothetical protein